MSTKQIINAMVAEIDMEPLKVLAREALSEAEASDNRRTQTWPDVCRSAETILVHRLMQGKLLAQVVKAAVLEADRERLEAIHAAGPSERGL